MRSPGVPSGRLDAVWLGFIYLRRIEADISLMQLLRTSIGAWLSGIAVLLLASVMPVAARSVVDATGRTVEIPERIGKIWKGSFRVEFDTARNGEAENVSLPEPQGEAMSFAINTDTGEIRIDSK